MATQLINSIHVMCPSPSPSPSPRRDRSNPHSHIPSLSNLHRNVGRLGPDGRPSGGRLYTAVKCPRDCRDPVVLKKRGIIRVFNTTPTSKGKVDPFSSWKYDMNGRPIESALGYDYFQFADGCDFEHWQIHTKPLTGSPSPDLIIAYYVQIFAQVLGSEDEAIKRIYSVATRHNYGFGANVSDDLVAKLMVLPNVVDVNPDTYVDPIAKRYPWDPFINGRALPYDPINYPHDVPDLSKSDEDLIRHGTEKTLPDLSEVYELLGLRAQNQMTGLSKKDIEPEAGV